MAAFRMHLRAHGTVVKIFNALHDADINPSLGLSTAAIMYMMSRDRLNVDLDRDALELLTKLLCSDVEKYKSKKMSKLSAASIKEYERMQIKVKEVIAQLKKEGGAKSIEVHEVTVSTD